MNEYDENGSAKKENKKYLIAKKSLALLLVCALIVGGLSGAVIYNLALRGKGITLMYTSDYEEMKEVNEKYSKLEGLYQYLNSKYYKDLDEDSLMTGIYKGLFEGTGDPYTQYLTSEEYEEALVTATGDFTGIGVTITSQDDEIVVVSTMEGSPAEQAGIKTGDIIVSVDGTAYTGSEIDDAANAMRGELNTKVTVSIKRNGEITEKKLTRKKITTESVYSKYVTDDIGYIRITSFETQTADDFKKELESMEKDGAKGVIIDIRNNGGGLVDSGLSIADMLLPECTIIYLEDKNGERVYKNSDASATSLPYVLLVNGGSASTSEILTAAIKDNKGGSIVGEKTFGKGIVQSLEKLEDGSAVKITVQQYFSPNGNVIHGVGITPDYEVSIPENSSVDTQLNKAIEILEQ